MQNLLASGWLHRKSAGAASPGLLFPGLFIPHGACGYQGAGGEEKNLAMWLPFLEVSEHTLFNPINIIILTCDQYKSY